MPQWTVISKKHHEKAHYLPRQGYLHTARQLVAPILLAELPKLVQHYVLGFITHGEKYQPIALLGLEKDRNLYLHSDNRWLGDYVPASLRGYPFSLAPNQDGQLALCIDADYLTDDPNEGEPLFTQDGHPSEHVAKMIEFHQECETNRQRTQAAVDALQKTDPIEPWPLEISRGEGIDPLQVSGFYRVSEKALNALETDVYSGLRGAPMVLAHGQLFSTHQIAQLTERARFHSQQEETPAATDDVDIGKIFGEDDIFKF